ncbi:MAG: hypothetical protein HYT31_05055 [Parcubacteria group bacterium]|nr:hypothetical protein [Parcubacteria group bacterium]
MYQERVMLAALATNAMEIRDVQAGEQAFLYSSGNHGPGYVTIKGKVGQKSIIVPFAYQLAIRVAEAVPDLDFVAGNVSGGVVPGWILSEALENLMGRRVPFVYIRDTRKKGGQRELITGLDNPDVVEGGTAVVVEELVNFAQTTCNGAEALRASGYNVTHACCILFYGNPKSVEALRETGLEMVYLFTLREFLDVAGLHHTHTPHQLDIYREFLKDPLGWQARHGLEPVKDGGTR